MAKLDAKFIAELVNYPPNGSFQELLTWHLSWGTRPYCDRLDKTNNDRWVRSKFAEFVHEEGFPLESAKKNLRNWANEGRLPDNQDDHDAERVSRILREFFGNDPNLRHWAADLQNALDRGRAEVEARVAGSKVTAEPNRVQPTPVSDFDDLREHALRLKVEQLATAQRSALLCATEAKRANDEGRFDTAMRFALGGWLASTRFNLECPQQVVAELRRGARGVRRLLSASGFNLHAYYRTGQSAEGVLLSEGSRIFVQSLADNIPVQIFDFGDWFAILPEKQLLAYYRDGTLCLRSLSEIFDDAVSFDFVWPENLTDTPFQYFHDKSRSDEIFITPDESVIGFYNHDRIQVWRVLINNFEKLVDENFPISLNFPGIISPDGRFFASCILTNRVALWDISLKHVLCDIGSLCIQTGIPSKIWFSEDSQELYVLFDFIFESQIYIVSTVSFSIIREINVTFCGDISCFDRWAVGVWHRFLRIFDAYSHKVVFDHEFSGMIRGYLFSKDGNILFVNGNFGIQAYEIENSKLLYQAVTSYAYVSNMCLSDSGEFICFNWAGWRGGIEDSGKAICRASDGHLMFDVLDVANLTVDPCNLFAAVSYWPHGTGSSRVEIYDIKGNPIEAVELVDGSGALRFSHDGRRLLVFRERSWHEDSSAQLEVLDTEYEECADTETLVRYVCDVKLRGRGYFQEQDFAEALYKGVPVDILEQCNNILHTLKMS